MRRVVLALVLFQSVSVSARTITFDDLYSMPVCEDPQISPDGQRILFVLKESDAGSGSEASHLWTMNVDGTGVRQMTSGSDNEWHPRWAPSGEAVYFLSDASGSDQVWVDGAPDQQVTRLPSGVSSFQVDPLGRRLLLQGKDYPECSTDTCYRRREGELEARPIEALLYDRLLYRHYKSWDDELVNRLFIVDMQRRTRKPLLAVERDIPTAYLGGDPDYTFSPDGSEIAFVMSLDSAPALGVNNDVFAVSTRGGEPLRTSISAGCDIEPQYSPDGRFLAWLSQARYGYESDQRELVVHDRIAGTYRNLTEHFDRSVGEYVWAPSSDALFLTAIDRGFSKIYRVGLTDGEVTLVTEEGHFGDLCVSPDGRFLAVSRSLSHQPSELYRYDLAAAKLTRLTFFTDDITVDLSMSQSGEFWFPGFNGDSVHGFLTLPPEFDAKRRYPLVLLIHGGPQWCWLGNFNYYGWNTQLVAAQGYVVAQINPHGSVGYGRTFKEYISGNWGRGDYEDLMLGIEYLIGQYMFIDSSHMAALGRSYGGFMVNWICGHTDRFSCLIGIDGSANQVSAYGSTEELWFPEWEFDGTPWSNPEEYRRASPITYAERFKTPMMLIHGALDYRVDLSEGLQMFTALQRHDVPSQLLVFPDEGHAVGKIENHRYVYEQQFAWLQRWLQPVE